MSSRIRSRWANQFKELSNSSKFHLRIRELLAADSLFSSIRCYQEVPVTDLCPNYPNPSHRFDWYIEDLDLIIELHGEQHYKVTNRGNVGRAQAEREFRRGQGRDMAKKQAAEEAGYTYLEIPYKMLKKLNPETLRSLIFKGHI